MGRTATELNLHANLIAGPHMTNRRFNFDKFRVCIRLTCQKYDGSFQDYLGGVADLKRQDNPGF